MQIPSSEMMEREISHGYVKLFLKYLQEFQFIITIVVTKMNRNLEWTLVSKIEGHFVASILTKPKSSKGLSVLDLYKKILNNKIDINLKDKVNKIYYKIVGNTPEEKLNEFKYDFDFAKKNLSYFKVSEISTLKNEDTSITDIEYKMDLNQKKSLNNLSSDKFTSYLYFPN